MPPQLRAAEMKRVGGWRGSCRGHAAYQAATRAPPERHRQQAIPSDIYHRLQHLCHPQTRLSHPRFTVRHTACADAPPPRGPATTTTESDRGRRGAVEATQPPRLPLRSTTPMTHASPSVAVVQPMMPSEEGGATEALGLLGHSHVLQHLDAAMCTHRPDHHWNRKGANSDRPRLPTPSAQPLLHRGRPSGMTSDLCAIRFDRLTPSNDHHRLDSTSLRRQHCHTPLAVAGEGPDQSTARTLPLSNQT
jgi:hypothetical protein